MTLQRQVALPLWSSIHDDRCAYRQWGSGAHLDFTAEYVGAAETPADAAAISLLPTLIAFFKLMISE